MAHDDEPGVTVEAAASLFGGEDDATKDFFSLSFQSHDAADVSSDTLEAAPADSSSALFEGSSYDAFSSVDATPWPAQPSHTSSSDHTEWQEDYGQWHHTHDYACTRLVHVC